MPSRVIDGDKMHQSDKIAALPGWAQPEYAWLYALADANGVLELTNLRAVYSRAYAIRSRFSFAKFTKLIQLFNSVGLLFIWEADGKRYGYWTGAERRGRLPSLSTRARYNPIGILPPADQLRAFYKRFGIRETSADTPVVNQSRFNRDEIVTGVGVDVGLGLGKGKGTEKSKPSCPPPADEVNAATSQSSGSAPEVSPTRMELANLLRQRIHENNSRARITEKQVIAWGRQVDLMIRMDNRTVEEITVLIEWSQRDPFWKTVVLSMKKLREKFDQLTMKSKVQPIAGEPPWISRERADEEKQREGWRVISKLAKEAGK
jgi:hypothetical protein